jgi:hypothetical protein
MDGLMARGVAGGLLVKDPDGLLPHADCLGIMSELVMLLLLLLLLLSCSDE